VEDCKKDKSQSELVEEIKSEKRRTDGHAEDVRLICERVILVEDLESPT
jgi:hypothetical protein